MAASEDLGSAILKKHSEKQEKEVFGFGCRLCVREKEGREGRGKSSKNPLLPGKNPSCPPRTEGEICGISLSLSLSLRGPSALGRRRKGKGEFKRAIRQVTKNRRDLV